MIIVSSYCSAEQLESIISYHGVERGSVHVQTYSDSY